MSDLIGEDVEQPLPPNPLIDFWQTLYALTPRVYVTRLLVGANVAVFIVMALSGVGILEPTIGDLLKWGANFGPRTVGGQWWRLFTSMFLHIGAMHIAFNMIVLADAGPLVERLLGNVGYLLLYVVAGLCGSMASLLWNPMAVSAGASGAIFGVYGALLGLLTRQQGSIPKPMLTRLRNGGLVFLGFNFLFGMTQENIDFAAHLGGLVAGFLGGIVMSQPFTIEARAGRTLRNVVVGILGLAAVGGGIMHLQEKLADLPAGYAALENVNAVESQAVDAFNAALTKWKRDELNGKEFADVLERDVLPPWRASRERIAGLHGLPVELQKRVTTINEYMRLRQEAWELYAAATRSNDWAKLREAAIKLDQSDQAAGDDGG